VPVTEEEMNARCLAASMIKPGDIVVVSGSYGGVAVEVVEIKEIIEERYYLVKVKKASRVGPPLDPPYFYARSSAFTVVRNAATEAKQSSMVMWPTPTATAAAPPSPAAATVSRGAALAAPSAKIPVGTVAELILQTSVMALSSERSKLGVTSLDHPPLDTDDNKTPVSFTGVYDNDNIGTLVLKRRAVSERGESSSTYLESKQKRPHTDSSSSSLSTATIVGFETERTKAQHLERMLENAQRQVAEEKARLEEVKNDNQKWVEEARKDAQRNSDMLVSVYTANQAYNMAAAAQAMDFARGVVGVWRGAEQAAPPEETKEQKFKSFCESIDLGKFSAKLWEAGIESKQAMGFVDDGTFESMGMLPWQIARMRHCSNE